MVGAGHQGFVVNPGIQVVAAQGHGPGGGPVVGVLAADELDAARLAHPLEVGPGQLDGRLDGLRPAAGEEGARQVAGGKLRHLLGQADGRLGGGAHGHIGELEHLLIGGVGDFLAPVAHVLEPQARHGVNGGVALGVGDPHPLARHVDSRLAPFGHVAGFPQVDPQVLKGGILEFLKSGGAGHAASRRRLVGIRVVLIVTAAAYRGNPCREEGRLRNYGFVTILGSVVKVDSQTCDGFISVIPAKAGI